MKKVVHYIVSPDNFIVEGTVAFVVPVDHPDTYNVTNNYPVRTSKVLKFDIQTGEFETLNSIYKPVVV